MRNQATTYSSSYQHQRQASRQQKQIVVPRFHRAAFIFIGNMALADFLLVPISIIVLQLEQQTKRRLDSNDEFEIDSEIKRNCRLQVLMWVFFMSVSLFSTVTITVDR